ncbi:D-glycero-beta-D-manno-heptose 1-phosphate adenylyltransferase [bacterium]|nr:D-glycero-beta-D-manno-heptose 1-phosphate adenylyltransferase [bacterium]MBU1066085.1 D-glycero-beta-D-manno-heptose 1-phosphate adenylyltransferase [bacterium]MBU1634082.1 D-glycero-beta-D-manno-heptose 1-phosphate adenylyltransferase [bacterium]MBU1874515.1 D-glycero-beta-D-manno-heptose 1-phosphate adenylyltransferase [bacterium]
MQTSNKLVSRTKLVQIVAKIRKEKKRIVFTNGCFDILHAGHIELLEKAKSFGDYLVVGLNSDLSVKKIKGRNRPIFPETDRARLLAALEAVDYVVLFDEETPYEILRQLQPEVLVKGGDYQIDEIVGHDFIPDVKVIPLVRGKSTTGIIGKILSESE